MTNGTANTATARLMPWSDGASRFVRQWPGATADDVVVYLHGAESHSGWFTDVAERLSAQGVGTFAYDRLGWGQSPGARGRLRSHRLALRELAEALRLASSAGARLHLVGMSWGGLLAAAARQTLGDQLTTVTLIAPALFPRRRFMTWPSMRRLALGRMLPLQLTPRDFTDDPELQRFIANDPWRMSAVSPSFFAATAMLLGQVRQLPRAGQLPKTQVLLAERDPIADTARIIAWAEQRQIPYQQIPNTVHSLVLERPAEVAASILGIVSAAGHGAGDDR